MTTTTTDPCPICNSRVDLVELHGQTYAICSNPECILSDIIDLELPNPADPDPHPCPICQQPLTISLIGAKRYGVCTNQRCILGHLIDMDQLRDQEREQGRLIHGYATTRTLRLTPEGPLPVPIQGQRYHIWTIIPDGSGQEHIIAGTAQWEPRKDSNRLYCYVYRTDRGRTRKAYAGSEQTLSPQSLLAALMYIN